MLKFKSFFNELLAEDAIDLLKNTKKEIKTDHDVNAQHKEPHAIIDHLAKADPNPKKKNTPWIVGQYQKGHIRQEDNGRVHETLSNFEKYKPKLANKDINSYKHISHLDTALEPHVGTVSSNKEAKRIVKHEGSTELHNDKDLAVHEIKTQAAACHYGAGTKWCTAAKNNNPFNEYHKMGPLYVIHDKKENKKYQFHFASHQFMNEKDEPVRIGDLTDKMPGLTKIKHFQDHPDYGFLFKSPEEHKKHLDKLFGQ